MIEAYAFTLVFAVQIFTVSILYPAWFMRYVRVKAEDWYADARTARLYPGWDRARGERFFKLYRVANTLIAVLGLALLTWLFTYMQRPDWTDGPVEHKAALYFLLQMSPTFLVCLAGGWINRRAFARAQAEPRRTASLQRRGLFDFVSPVTILAAVLANLLFAALMLYLHENPVPGPLRPLTSLGAITLGNFLLALIVYRRLYGRKSTPLETQADRLHLIGAGVRAAVYSALAVPVFLLLNFTLVLQDLQRWEPVAQSVFMVVTMLVSSRGLSLPPRQPEGVAGNRSEALS